jgi:hypothetical protein
VQIFQHQHQRLFRRQRFDGLHHLPQQALAGGSQHRHVGYARAAVFETLAVPEPARRLAHGFLGKGIDQCCFAEPCLPGHEHHLAGSFQCFVQPSVEAL